MANAAMHSLDIEQAPIDPSELKLAFHRFNEMSQQLTDSYAFLENKVAQLSGELATVSAQRMQELAEKERLADRLESLLQMLPAGVLLINENGVITQSNAAADDLLLAFAGADSLIGLRWRAVIAQCFKPRRDDGHEISLVDGRRVSLRTAAMTNERGQLILLTDMTETRALQAQLSQHERLSAMGKMVASLAHQIRTPLAAATLYTGHLASEDLPEESRLRFAGKLRERLHHLERQVRDMLIFARGEAPLNDRVTLGELMSDLEAAMEVPLAQYRVHCDVICDDPTIELVCHRDALTSAIMNLVNNALESCDEPIELGIIARIVDDSVCIQVMDNGPGLSAQEREKMLEPFFTTKSNGTGLGLAVVQAVVRAHHGEFRLSDSPLGGLSADLLLPFNHG